MRLSAHPFAANIIGVSLHLITPTTPINYNQGDTCSLSPKTTEAPDINSETISRSPFTLLILTPVPAACKSKRQPVTEFALTSI